MTEYTAIAAFLCIGLSVFAVAVVLMGLGKALLRAGVEPSSVKKTVGLTAAGILGWICGTSALAAAGVYEDFSAMPPRFFLNVILPLVLVLIVTFSKRFARLLPHVPPQWLVYTQAFRIPVEIFLWLLFLDGVVPIQMSFEGLNMDVFSGILAIPAGWWVAQRRKGWRKVLLAYNVVGLLLLLNILVIAILSAPLPIRMFMNEPANTFVTRLPWVYLPAVLVTLAYALHAFSLRWLWVTREA